MAAIAAGAVAAVKIGLIVAKILHLVIEVLTVIMLAAATALVCIVAAWLTVWIVRARGRRRRLVSGLGAVHVAGTGPGRSPLLVARAQEVITDGAVVYAIDPKARYEVPVWSDDLDAG